MANRYTPSNEAAKQLQDILAQGKSLESSGKDESLFNLLSAGFSTMMTLSEAQNEAFLTAVPEAQRDNPQFQATRNLLDKSKTILSEVNLSLLQNQQKKPRRRGLNWKSSNRGFLPL